jgi:origin recognition complex subunit 3
MDFQTCYVYNPSARKNDRPVKRRRIEPLQGLQTSWPLRRSLYQRLWAKQQHRLKVDISILIPFPVLTIETEFTSGD